MDIYIEEYPQTPAEHRAANAAAKAKHFAELRADMAAREQVVMAQHRATQRTEVASLSAQFALPAVSPERPWL